MIFPDKDVPNIYVIGEAIITKNKIENANILGKEAKTKQFTTVEMHWKKLMKKVKETRDFNFIKI